MIDDSKYFKEAYENITDEDIDFLLSLTEEEWLILLTPTKDE